MSHELLSTEAYQRALDFVYGLINFERQKLDRYTASKLDAARPGRLMGLLGEPQQQFRSIHVAGTKGKGSVSAMCANCLRLAGLRVGLYTSPHVREFRERIRVMTPDDPDGRISEADFVTLVEAVKTAVSQVPDATWFEVVTALAFCHFARQQVDLAVVEVGLGGRLDATNVLTPLVSVITSLSLDHTELLGDTLADIAYEKGGIIKPGVPVVTASQPPEALNRLLQITLERESPLSVVGRDWRYERGEQGQLVINHSPSSAFIPPRSAFRLSLSGDHQLENGMVAIATLAQVRPFFPQLTAALVQQGLATTTWPGRLEVIHHAPTVLLDCAHNQDSAAKLRAALQQNYRYDRLWLVFGAPSDKNIVGMMRELFPLAAGVFVTKADHPRATAPEALAQQAHELGFAAEPYADVGTAVTAAWHGASPNDLICITGSIILIGDLLNQWDSLKSTRLSL